MAKRGDKKQKPPLPGASDPQSMTAWMHRYLTWMRMQNYSERTVENRESYLRFFIVWCSARSLAQPQEITKPILERYQRHLFHLRKQNGQPISARGQHCRLVPVRAYFKWLTRKNILRVSRRRDSEMNAWRPKTENRHALPWMRVGPSGRDCRITSQTTGCCDILRGVVVSESEKAGSDLSGVAHGS